MSVGRLTRLEIVALLAAGVTIASLCAALCALSYVGGATVFRDSELYADRMNDCQTASLSQLGFSGASKPDLPTLKNVTDHCFNYILYADELGESNITRGMYIHQRYENNVILFMVVLITFSGVGLAELQLLTSYNLATTTRAAVVADAAARRQAGAAGASGGEGEAASKAVADVSEVALEHGKLTVRSSVTGVIIIALSFAFFFVYVVSVYSVRVPADPQEAAATNSAAANATQQTSLGGNGPPPPN